MDQSHPQTPLRGDRYLIFGRVLLAMCALGVATICLVNGDFAFQRQPVPASWPMRAMLVHINIAALALSGVLLLVRRWASRGAGLLAVNLGLWALILHGPRIAGGVEAAWLGAAECLAVAAAAARLSIERSGRAPLGGEAAVRSTEAIFAISVLAFAAAHFIYAVITASMVPKWLPAPMFWGLFTGAAHAAAGFSILARVQDRLASRLLTAMLASFTVLVNLPMALRAGGVGASAVDLAFAAALTGSAAIFAAFAARRH